MTTQQRAVAMPWHIAGLMAALDDLDRDVKRLALETIARLQVGDRLKPHQVEKLERALRQFRDSDSKQERLVFLEFLATSDTSLTVFSPDVESLLRDTDDAIREAAVRAMGRLGPLTTQSIEHLVALLRYEDASVHVAATRVLGEAGKKAVDDVVVLFGDPDPCIRQVASNVLSQMEMEGLAKDTFNKYIAQLSEPDPQIRGQAAIMLGHMGEGGKGWDR